ncbi:DNA helicase UvrD [Candidatus Pacearchaeota archaeon]|nr:DNA helicase UvrD [Candidatus Pacearchaeota archaeon]
MRIIADLQIHSRFARATSKDITLANLEKWARIKGIDLLGTGDFQHPEWRKEIDAELSEDEQGILRSKTGFPFIWQTEVSLMFSQGGKRRAVHVLIFSPHKSSTDAITSYLGSKGRLDYDGRPIFGMSCENLVRDLKAIDELIEIIPAHCMTPWFGLYGSDSGFDSLQECFGEQAKHIHAIESGMSASPAMLWRFKEQVQVVSFSDAHSFWPWRLGREATLFELPQMSYSSLVNSIRTGHGLVGTIETPPEYGKYHWDGHRICNFSCGPEETKQIKGICPVCSKPLTIGVEYRIEALAKEPQGYIPKNNLPFFMLVPLHELISLVYETGVQSKRCWTVYNELIALFGTELRILLEVPHEELVKAKVHERLCTLILFGREGKLQVTPGYDGVYGKVIMPDQQARLS